ncbi:MAG: TonB family protein [Acidobacteriota bacterium]
MTAKPAGVARLWVVVAMVAYLGSARAADIVVVRSGDSPAFAEAMASFKKTTITGNLMEVDVKGIGAFEPGIVQQLRPSPPKAFLAFGSPAAKACKEAKLGVPIIHVFAYDAAAMGLSGDLVGGIVEAPIAAQMKAASDIGPAIKRIGILHVDPTVASQAASAAVDLGLTLVARQLKDAASVPAATRELLGQVDALVVVPDPALSGGDTLKFVFRTAIEMGKPTLSFSEQHLGFGAVMSLFPEPADSGTYAAELVNKVLKSDASYAGNHLPRTLKLAVNRTAAGNIGLALDTTGAKTEGNFLSRTGTIAAPPSFTVAGVAVASTVSATGSAPEAAPSAAAPSAAAPAPSGSPDTQPLILDTVEAEYPPLAQKQGKDGQVVIEATVAADGTLREAKVVRGSSLFNDAALKAAKRYKFAPARKAGEPVDGVVTLTITFRH